MKPTEQPKPVTAIPACNTCRWSMLEGDNINRCHLNPPVLGLPYYDKSYWPIVPKQGGGCKQHETK